MHFEESFTLLNDSQQRSAETTGYILFFLDASGFVVSYHGDVDKVLSDGAVSAYGLSFLRLMNEKNDSLELRTQIIAYLIEKGKCNRQLHVENSYGSFSFSVHLATLRDVHGDFCGFTMLMIPMRQTADVAVLDMILEIKDYAIFRISTDGFVENWNRGAEQIKGYLAHEIIGKHFSLFYTAEDQSSGVPFALLEQAQVNGSAHVTGWRLCKGGKQFWGKVSITAIRDLEDEVTGFSVVTRDLTEERDAELSLREVHRELQIRTQDVEQLALAASHDLLSPANSIISLVGLLQDKLNKKLGHEDQYLFQAIEDSASRIVKMLKTLLEHLKVDGNSKMENCNLNRIIDHVKMDLRLQILESEAVIHAPTFPKVYGYPIFLYQLFQNLLSNAIKFSREGIAPIIHIHATEEIDHWLFCVRDNGIGIPAEEYESVFTMFKRIHADSLYPGNGIGLATCRKIVAMHGGNIWVESNSESGSSFFFTLFK